MSENNKGPAENRGSSSWSIDHSTNAREVAQATKRREKLQKQLKECRDYDEKILNG